VIYVIDSTDEERLSESKRAFGKYIVFYLVLALAGIEFVFLLLCFGFSTRRMMITLVFLVVTKKSRTFSSPKFS